MDRQDKNENGHKEGRRKRNANRQKRRDEEDSGGRCAPQIKGAPLSPTPSSLCSGGWEKAGRSRNDRIVSRGGKSEGAAAAPRPAFEKDTLGGPVSGTLAEATQLMPAVIGLR